MRKRIMLLKYLLITICIILLLIIPTEIYAYSGEIDPENYINLPNRIDSETGGTITINSSAGSGYTVYYQYEFITSTKENQLSNAVSEYNQDIEEYNNIVETAEAEIEAAYDEYERLSEDSSATEEQINEAYQNYENIFEAKKQLVEEKKAELEEKLASIYELYPTYTEANWEETINNKVQVDVSEYSGEVHFVLWVKLVSSGGTYYDVSHYSSVGTKEINLGLNKTTAEVEVENTIQLTATTNSENAVTWTSNKENIATVNSSGLVTGVAEGVAIITAEVEGKTATCTVTVKAKKQTEGEDDGITWADFSNAKVRLVRKDYRSDYYIVVSGVPFEKDKSTGYEIYISTSKNTVPDIKETSSYYGWRRLDPSSSSVFFNPATELGTIISPSIYELSGDKLYVWVREGKIDPEGDFTYKMQLSEVEVERLPQSPLGTRINAYFFDDYTSTFLWDYYDSANDKNLEYKIGRITDTTILRAIKNGETGCLDKLMTYAKNASDGYTGTCIVGRSDSITNKLGLVDDAYYYVYFELDTENGKYYPIEDVSLYQASCYESYGTYKENLFDYLSDEFVWNLGDEQTPTPSTPEDNTISTEKLPNTGKTILTAIAIISVIALGTIAYKKYINLKGI